MTGSPPSDSSSENQSGHSPLQEKVSDTTTKPGVYMMKDALDQIIYVGKARNLKKRLASYFRPMDQLGIKTGVLSRRIKNFETIVTRTEKEALILESTLIKKHKPRYNVILKDDKRYPSLRLDLNHPFPNLTVVRKTPLDGAAYFGPFASALAVRQSLKFINKTFKLRKCKNREFAIRTRPCLHYQMEACLGPCCLKVDRKLYGSMVREVTLFLKGRTPKLIRRIKAEMKTAAEKQNYEKAARFRDKMFALERTLEKQVAVTTDFKDRDVLSIARSEDLSLMMHFHIRGGYLTGSREVDFSQTFSTDGELIRTYIRQHYEKNPFVPGEIIVSELPEDAALLEEWLQEIRGKRVHLHRPHRGEKAKLLELVRNNAENRIRERRAQMKTQKDLIQRLQRCLRIARLPRQIECFDNSNISGTSAVSGMVVFKDGAPCKSLYRKYKIRSVSYQDDYAYMAEVLTRRYGRPSPSPSLPDLLMVDGGKGQLNIAVAIIRSLGLENRFDIIGIAKKDTLKGESRDKVFLPGRANPVNLDREEDLLLFLQRIRDEAHRFAIAFHRRRRTAGTLHSELDSIPGIGRVRKRRLLSHFGGVRQIRDASIREMSRVPGMTRQSAEAVKKTLSGSKKQ